MRSLLFCVILGLKAVAFADEASFEKDVDIEEITTYLGNPATADEIIEIAALGPQHSQRWEQLYGVAHSPRFGQLYDARTDQFRSWNVFDLEELDDDYVTETDVFNNTKIDYIMAETALEKMKKLKIHPLQALHCVSGIHDIEMWSEDYLNHNKRSVNSVKASLVYRIRTVREVLKTLHVPRRIITDKYITNHGIKYYESQATHVVVGIEWGGDAVLSLEVPYVDPSEASYIRGKLVDTLKTIGDSLGYNYRVNLTQLADVEKLGNIIVDLVSDDGGAIGFTTKEFSIIHQVTKIRNFYRDLIDEELGKGVKKRYILMPYHKFVDIFGGKSNANDGVQVMSNETCKQFIKIFQSFKDLELNIEEIRNAMNTWNLAFSEDEVEKAKEISKQFYSFETEWKEIFHRHFSSFRGNRIDYEALRSSISSYKNSNWTVDKFNTILEPLKSAMEKSRLLNALRFAGVIFIKSESQKDTILERKGDNEIKIFSLTLNSLSQNHVNKITRLLKAEPGENLGVMKYYIENVPDVITPNVTIYLSNGANKTLSIDDAESLIKNGCSRPSLDIMIQGLIFILCNVLQKRLQ